MLPRLHIISDDRIVARDGFAEVSRTLMQAYGGFVALHLRAKRTAGRKVYDLAELLQDTAGESGSTLYVNDRLDVAYAVGCKGVQLGTASLPVMHARRIAPALSIGYSAHGVGEAAGAVDDGADFILLGTIWPSGSHAGECGAGTDLLRRATAAVAAPVLAIGGVTPVRAQEAMLCGAHGVAVISGVWEAMDAIAAVKQYLDAIQDVT